MNEHFDDRIRRRLQHHESDVPEGLFEALQQHPDVQDAFFDAAIRNKAGNAESPVPSTLFHALQASVDLENLAADGSIQARMNACHSPVPAGMWERITAEKDKKRRPVGWWWMAAALLLLGLGGSTLYLLNSEQKSKRPVSVNRQTGTDSYASSKPAEQPQAETSANEKEVGVKNEPTGTNATLQSKNDNSGNSFTPADKTVQPDRSNFLRKGYFVIHSNKPEGIVPDPADKTALPSEDAEAHYYSRFTSRYFNQGNFRFADLSLSQRTVRLTPDQLLQAKAGAPVIPCPTNTEDDKHRSWYVDVYGSAFMLQKTVQDNYGSQNAKAGFDSTLHQQVSFNAGISLVKNIGNRLLLRTGLQYNRINESFRLTRINERRQVTTISIRTVIIAPGDTVHIRDTSTTEQIGTAQYRNQNRYTQWDVPVIFGYELGGENFRMVANAGIITNIRSSYSGEMLADSTRQVFDLNNYKGSPVYRRSVGFSLYAGLSILKPLSEKASLLIEPHARIGLSNTTNSQAWFSQKNNTLGISIGIRYKLGGSRQRLY